MTLENCGLGQIFGVQDMALIVILWLAIQGRRVVAIVLCWMLDAVLYAKPMLCQYCRGSEIIPSLKCWKLPFRFCAIFCLQKGSYFSGGALSASSGVPDIGKALDGERWLREQFQSLMFASCVWLLKPRCTGTICSFEQQQAWLQSISLRQGWIHKAFWLQNKEIQHVVFCSFDERVIDINAHFFLFLGCCWLNFLEPHWFNEPNEQPQQHLYNKQNKRSKRPPGSRKSCLCPICHWLQMQTQALERPQCVWTRFALDRCQTCLNNFKHT